MRTHKSLRSRCTYAMQHAICDQCWIELLGIKATCCLICISWSNVYIVLGYFKVCAHPRFLYTQSCMGQCVSHSVSTWSIMMQLIRSLPSLMRLLYGGCMNHMPRQYFLPRCSSPLSEIIQMLSVQWASSSLMCAFLSSSLSTSCSRAFL